MAYLKAFGSYLPSRVVTNAEAGALAGCDADWIRDVSGIEERRYASEDETVAAMATLAASRCLERAGVAASSLGMIFVASGSSERRFPGPAATVANSLGLDTTPSIDLPLASAGSLFGMGLAAEMAARVGPVLVVASEKMSAVALREPRERGVMPLFGDGAGACLITPDTGAARIVDWVLASDGAFAEDLRLEFEAPLAMNGRSVILQASRKMPRAISEVLARNSVAAGDVEVFLMHQANQNLIARVAQAAGVPEQSFFSNIARYGNTSSASMLIAADEWVSRNGLGPGKWAVFTAFGAGFHWGALLAEGV